MVYQMNCLGTDPFYERGLSLNELMLFTIASLVIVSLLLSYYNKISNKSNSLKKIDIPIYNSKDLFLQDTVGDSNFVLAEKTTSIFTRITVYLLSFLIATTSIYKLITNGLIEFIG